MLRPVIPWLGRRLGSLDYAVEGADGETRHVIAVQAHAETDALTVISFKPADPEIYSCVTLLDPVAALTQARHLVAIVTNDGDKVHARLTEVNVHAL